MEGEGEGVVEGVVEGEGEGERKRKREEENERTDGKIHTQISISDESGGGLLQISFTSKNFTDLKKKIKKIARDRVAIEESRRVVFMNL